MRATRARDLARDKGLAADRALVIEQDAVGGEHAVGLTVVHRDPVAVELGDAIGRTRIERRGLLLRHFLHQAVQFRGRCLIEPRFLLHAENPDRFEQAQHADRVGIGGIFRALEADADVALRGKIVDLGRPDLLHQPDQIGRIRHVAVVQQERHIAGVRIFVEVIDARGVERRRPPLDAVHGVAEAEQIFGEISAVLPGDAGEQRHPPFRILNRHFHSNRQRSEHCPTDPERFERRSQPTDIALDPPATLGPKGARPGLTQTPTMTLFLQANESRKAPLD